MHFIHFALRPLFGLVALALMANEKEPLPGRRNWGRRERPRASLSAPRRLPPKRANSHAQWSVDETQSIALEPSGAPSRRRVLTNREAFSIDHYTVTATVGGSAMQHPVIVTPAPPSGGGPEAFPGRDPVRRTAG